MTGSENNNNGENNNNNNRHHQHNRVRSFLESFRSRYNRLPEIEDTDDVVVVVIPQNQQQQRKFSKEIPYKILNDLPDTDLECTTSCENANNNGAEQSNANSKFPARRTSVELAATSGSGCWNYTGIILCLLSSMTLSLTALIVKLLHDYHSFNLTVWRYTFGNAVPAIPILIYLCCWKKKDVFSPIWPLTGEKRREKWMNVIGLLFRGVVGGSATVLRFCALKYLSLAEVSVITRCTPALVIVLAHFFLKEKCNIFSVIAAFLAIVGVFVLSKPPILTGGDQFDTETLIGIGLSAGTLLCTAISIIVSRKLRKVNFALLIFTFGVIGALEGGILSWSIEEFKIPQNSRDIILIGLLCFLSFLGQLFAVLAIKCENAGTISVCRTSYVLFAFIWQIFLLHVYPDVLTIIGATVVMAGIFLIALRKWIVSMPEDAKVRNCFSSFKKTTPTA